MSLVDPRQAQSFRFVRCRYDQGVAELVYAFDHGPELIEKITFPGAPEVPAERLEAFEHALDWLHLVAGVSYYKAGVPATINVEGKTLDRWEASRLEQLYTQGLAEFAYRNRLNLSDIVHFKSQEETKGEQAPALGLPDSTLVPIGGGKDSLVVIEALKRAKEKVTLVWVGHSPLVAACVERTGLPGINIKRELSPHLFEYNRLGAYNGHIPVTAVNSSILILAALLYGHNGVAFANERSASAATLEYEGQPVNHQWSKGIDFEQSMAALVHRYIAADLDYFSLLRPFSEVAVTAAFSRLGNDYHDVFSSCNRNFRILGPKPVDRWCGQCPKCHFVFLALAPFMPKTKLVSIFGCNLLDDEDQAEGFDALMAYQENKPFECVGEAQEARAAMAALTEKPEWAEDALVKRFATQIKPHLADDDLTLAPWLVPSDEHAIPSRLQAALDEIRTA